MCCLCIQFTHENTSERTILHQVSQKNSGGANPIRPPPPFPGLVACTAKKASYAPDRGNWKRLIIMSHNWIYKLFLTLQSIL